MSFDFDRLFDEVAEDNKVPSVEEVMRDFKKKQESSTQIDESSSVIIEHSQNNDVKENIVEPLKSDELNNDDKKSEKNIGKPPAGRKKKAENYTCQIRDFPKSLMTMIKQDFPDASNSKALAAFVYAYRNIDEDSEIDYSDVPSDVIEMAKSVERYNKALSTDREVRRINETLRRLNNVSDDIMLALSYLIYDRAGFRINTPARPGDIDFLEPGIQEVSNKVEKISDRLRQEKQHSEGRPKRNIERS